jgi:sec-independent protein translocase protein TatA
MGIDMGDAFAPWHIILLVIVLVLLFGAKRLPGAAQSLGQSMHIFRRSVSGLADDSESKDKPGSDAVASGSGLPPSAQQQLPSQPQQTAPDETRTQVEDLQRQVAELQRQAAGQNAGQQGQPR